MRWLWRKVSEVYPAATMTKEERDKEVELEQAICVAGFGRFNFALLAFALPAAIASMFDTTSMAYVITSAECDLNLSLIDKGFLNGVVHFGMISCGFLSGYLADTLGRRNMLVFGYLADFASNFVAAFSQNFLMLAVCKFFSGFLMCGPCTVILSCLSEFFPVRVQPLIVMYVGICFSLGTLVMPFVAWSMLSDPFDTVVSSTFVLHSWQIFMMVCSLPSLLAGLYALYLPESPRFLLSRGRKQDALRVLQRVYAINNGCSPDTYPVKQLKGEVKDVNESKAEGTWSALKGGYKQLQPLLKQPYLPRMVLVITIEFCCIMGCNTLRLWLPQLFKMMSEYSGENGSLCDMISVGENASVVETPKGDCHPIQIASETYVNSAIVASVQVAFATLAGAIINVLGKKNLIGCLLSVGGSCCLTLYWCIDAQQATALAAIAVAFNAIASNTLISIVVDIFPTALRATAASLALMMGRVGSMVGNLLFPILLTWGCLPPFATLSMIMFGCALVSRTIPKPQVESEGR